MHGQPFIPQTITVHLGMPDTAARNITVNFPDYVKNAACCELYPTWPENAIRANLYLINSFALNRVYSEWYRSKGYDFDITCTAKFDKAFCEGRNIFQPISEISDELFNVYVHTKGVPEPFPVSSIKEFSKWDTVELANQGYDPMSILAHFYGDDIEIINNTPVISNVPTYSGTALKLGAKGNEVKIIQTQINRISVNFSSIPKINPVDGIFGAGTESAVRKFQEIFNLPQTGIVDKAAWYKISFAFLNARSFSESDNQDIIHVDSYPGMVLKEGTSNSNVMALQQYLSFINKTYPKIMAVNDTGYFGNLTKSSVMAFQRQFGLPQNGIVAAPVWERISSVYSNLRFGNVKKAGQFPGYIIKEG